MRLDKALATSGYGTRTEVKALISKGLVSVKDKIIKDPGFRLEDQDISRIKVNGIGINYKEYIYLILNKPDEVLTSMEDKRLPFVGQYLPDNLKNRKVSPVGRLDFHTTGLLILTNDGNLSHRLTSPAYNIPKTYEVVYEGNPLNDSQIREAAEGITLTDTDEPVKLKPSALTLDTDNKALLTLTEGKTHEVRRIFAYWERPVISLKRISIGGLTLHEGQEEGVLEELKESEVELLRKITGLSLKDA